MLQSGLGEANSTQSDKNCQSVETCHEINLSNRTCQNGRTESTHKIENLQTDLTNGFKNSTLECERLLSEKKSTCIQPSTIYHPHQQSYSQCQELFQTDYPISQGDYSTVTRRQSIIGQPDNKQSVVNRNEVSQYAPDNVSHDCIPYMTQTAIQTLPVQLQPHLGADYVSDSSQYSQARSPYEVRSHMYSQQVNQYADRAGYVTKDSSYRDTSLHARAQSISNPVFTGGQSGYVTVQHTSHIPSQSSSPRPQTFFPGVVIPTQQSATAQGYEQFAILPQFPYGQFPQTVMNTIPYNLRAIYLAQQPPVQPQPLDTQRLSQEMAQYKIQPISQPKAQNLTTFTEKSGGARGLKPIVPQRGNSKITHDSAHRKSISIDTPVLQSGVPNLRYDSTNQSTRGTEEQIIPASTQDRTFSAPVNQTPRTRQDGLYVDSTGNHASWEKTSETIPSDCNSYTSSIDHRKSTSIDTTNNFERLNDTITFTFPEQTVDVKMTTRKPPPAGDKTRPDNVQVPSNDQKRVEPVLRVSTVPFDGRQDNWNSIVIQERNSEWGNISPNQRLVEQLDNRRSEYFENHRRSPMPLDPKHVDEVRRSPMPFVIIRDTSAERAAQKSPSFPNQYFDKTKQELAMWAEHRQRQDIERIMHQNAVFSSSPRFKNPTEDCQGSKVNVLSEGHRGNDSRLPQNPLQTVPNITQNSIIEQRRHLRHVSADLTKQTEFTRKDFDNQPITGSVTNLVPTINTVTSERVTPNLCYQYPALSEAKLDNEMLLTVVTDFGDNTINSNKQSDHIIHSHKKSHNISANLLTHSKSQAENLQTAQFDLQNESIKNNKLQQQQQQHEHQQQQSLDVLSEKLNQFERQQSDLQVRLQCLQNQNQILDQVAQIQHQQSDLHTRLQCLQERQETEKNLRQASEYQQKHSISPLPEHLLQSVGEKSNAHQNCSSTNVTSGLSTSDGSSPRLQNETTEIKSLPQISLPTNSQPTRSEGTRGSSQFQLACQATAVVAATTDMADNIAVSLSGATHTNPSCTCSPTTSGITISGTLKKVPPEKPPRTSLIVQSPELEVKRFPKSNHFF